MLKFYEHVVFNVQTLCEVSHCLTTHAMFHSGPHLTTIAIYVSCRKTLFSVSGDDVNYTTHVRYDYPMPPHSECVPGYAFLTQKPTIISQNYTQ